MSGKLDLKEILSGIDFDRVLRVAKARWVVIVCGLVVLVAPIVAWLLLDMARRPVVEELGRRSSAYDKLAALEKVAVEVKKADGTAVTETTVLNDEIIRRVAAHNRSLGGGAEAMYEAAVKRNRGCDDLDRCERPRHVMAAGTEAWLPEPKDASKRQVSLLAENPLKALEAARDAMLKSAGAGAGPDTAAVLEQVQRAEQEYLGTLRKRSRSEVTEPRELEALNATLVDARKEFLVQHANQLGFYLDPWALRWPALPAGEKADSDAGVDRALSTLFLYQWDLWLVDDVLSAIRRVNGDAGGARAGSASAQGPMTAPVKRVLQLSIAPIGLAAAESGDAAPATGGEGGGDAAAPSGEAIDAKTAVTPDFTVSVTGLKSNQLFDVRRATLRVVIETSALPRFIDALARQNFISVTGIAMLPADAYAAARQGFVYGPQACSDVTLTLESVWFREWVTERMPSAMRRALNTAGPAAKVPAEGEAPSEQSPPVAGENAG